MVMEDPKALHHLLLLRNFMSQGLVHDRHLLYASPFKDPGAFLGTLPNPISPKDNKKVSRPVDPDQEKGLRIAWQYMKYFGENHQNVDNHKGWWYWICWSYSHTVVMCSTCGYSDMRWQHLADTLLSVRAVPDKDMAKLLTGYQDMVGFLHVHKVSRINTQVPATLEAHTFSMKLERRKTSVLEHLN